MTPGFVKMRLDFMQAFVEGLPSRCEQVPMSTSAKDGGAVPRLFALAFCAAFQPFLAISIRSIPTVGA